MVTLICKKWHNTFANLFLLLFILDQSVFNSEAAAMRAVQCPLQPWVDPFLQSFCFTGRFLQEIEEHISTGDCHHPPLKDVVFHGSLDGTIPMLLACKYGDLDCVKRLVQTWKMDVNAPAVYYDGDDISHYDPCTDSFSSFFHECNSAISCRIQLPP